MLLQVIHYSQVCDYVIVFTLTKRVSGGIISKQLLYCNYSMHMNFSNKKLIYTKSFFVIF